MKHHYVPAFYLRSFTDPGCPPDREPYVWVVDLDEQTVRRRSPDNTAKLTDYYAVGDGPDRYEVEKYFALVEGLTKPVISKILGDCHAVEGEDKRILSHFAALQMVRVPRFRETIEAFITDVGESVFELMTLTRERFEAALSNTDAGQTLTTEQRDELYAACVTRGNFRIRANPSAALGHALKVVPQISDMLNHMSWAIMEPAGDENFWSSDNPLFYINPALADSPIGHGLGAKSIEVNLPVSPRRCLLMAWTDITGPRTLIKNLRISQERGIAGAKRYLFCSTERDANEAMETHRRFFRRRSDE